MARKDTSGTQKSLLATLLPRQRSETGSSVAPVVIPRFEFLKKLGEGGMASVFLARQTSNGRLVAVKTMLRHLNADARWAARFLDEARRLAELSHPNIVPVFDWGTHDGVDFIVMEYMKGGDLTTRLKTVPMSVRDAMDICAQVALGLDFAGSKGFVHRDIKPDNILFRENGSPCILDFGISKEITSRTTHSSQGLAIGTGAYMSPEQAKPGTHDLDQRSDLYSLGVILHELLTGQRPFEYRHFQPAEAFLLYVNAHSSLVPPPLPPVFAEFQSLMDRLLAKDPADRFGRGGEVRSAILQLEGRLSEELLSRPLRDLTMIKAESPPTIVDAPDGSALAASAGSIVQQPLTRKWVSLAGVVLIGFSGVVWWSGVDRQVLSGAPVPVESAASPTATLASPESGVQPLPPPVAEKLPEPSPAVVALPAPVNSSVTSMPLPMNAKTTASSVRNSTPPVIKPPARKPVPASVAAQPPVPATPAPVDNRDADETAGTQSVASVASPRMPVKPAVQKQPLEMMSRKSDGDRDKNGMGEFFRSLAPSGGAAGKPETPVSF